MAILDSAIQASKGTFFGDANLDGEFNTGDLTQVFEFGEYEDETDANSTWATGDWNVDGEFTTSDLVVAFQDGGYELGPRISLANVPKPTSLFILFVGIFGLFIGRSWNQLTRILDTHKQEENLFFIFDDKI